MNLFNSDTHRLIRSWLPTRSVRWLVWCSVWVLIGLISASHWYIFYLGGTPQGTALLFIGKVAFFVVWGAFTNVILWMAWRFPLTRQTFLKHISIMFVGSLIVCGVYYVIYSAGLSYILINEITLLYSWANLKFVLSQHSSWYYLMFWATVLAEYLSRNHRETLENQKLQAEIEQQMTQLHMATLKSQLQPHFFFNSLNLISALIANGRKEKAQAALIELSELLRKSFQTSRKNFTTVGEEIDFCRRYLNLLSYRFRDRLTVKFDVSPDVVEARIPSLLLQPIVENAVKHGVSANRGMAMISISCQQEESLLSIQVTNRGRLQSSAATPESSSGLGLTATHDLLQLLYLDEFEFSAARTSAEEFSVKITIPFERSSEVSIDETD